MSEMQHGDIPQWTTGWRLQRALSFAGVSVEEMADELGVSRSTVSRYLNDRGTPSRGYLKLWALRCGVPLEWLEWGDNTPAVPRSDHRSRHLELQPEPEITTQEVLALRKQLHGGRRGSTARRAPLVGAS